MGFGTTAANRGATNCPSPPRRNGRPATGDRLDATRNDQQSVISRRDLERRPTSGYESLGAVRAALGRGNPYERFGAGRYGAALLDLMVGEPVAYATGSPELKATGPFRTVSNSPITKSQREFVCGGVPRTFSRGRGRVGGRSRVTVEKARRESRRGPQGLRGCPCRVGTRDSHGDLSAMSAGWDFQRRTPGTAGPG